MLPVSINHQGALPATTLSFNLAPGVSLFLSYLWNDRKQNGFNWVTGQGVSATAPNGNPNNNKISAQLIYVGTAFSW